MGFEPTAIELHSDALNAFTIQFHILQSKPLTSRVKHTVKWGDFELLRDFGQIGPNKN